MPIDRIKQALISHVDTLRREGTAKGSENAIVGVVSATNDRGPRFLLQDRADTEFIRMNSNDYMGLSLERSLIEADESAAHKLAVGPGAVRFISGTWGVHQDLERRLASFHKRPSAMLFSSAYATVMGVLPALVDGKTVVLSDELNHNCIINAIKLARPKEVFVYPHLDLETLEKNLQHAAGRFERAIVVTDGVFSMRGDYAQLAQLSELANQWDDSFAGNVVVLVDDSHGVGAFGETGRGTEEVENSAPVDILISTLGKAVGVNGGYVVADNEIIEYLREVSPFYIYSNPIGPAEAAAALKAIDFIDSTSGRKRLSGLNENTRYFRNQLVNMGFETIDTSHPVVAIMIRDTTKTHDMVDHLESHGVLATGLTYPVVPRGQDEIRLQVNANHSRKDLKQVLDILGAFS